MNFKMKSFHYFYFKSGKTVKIREFGNETWKGLALEDCLVQRACLRGQKNAHVQALQYMCSLYKEISS